MLRVGKPHAVLVLLISVVLDAGLVKSMKLASFPSIHYLSMLHIQSPLILLQGHGGLEPLTLGAGWGPP